MSETTTKTEEQQQKNSEKNTENQLLQQQNQEEETSQKKQQLIEQEQFFRKVNKLQKNTLLPIFVHGLHPFTTREDIIETFSPLCTIHNLQFKRNPITGKHKGYAFFEVEDFETAQKLINMTHILHGRKIHCDFKNSDPEEKD